MQELQQTSRGAFDDLVINIVPGWHEVFFAGFADVSVKRWYN